MLNPPRWLSPSVLQAVLLGLLLMFVGGQYLLKTTDNRSAFNRWRVQVQDLAKGVDVYKKYIYPNAPIMGLILYPLAELPRLHVGGVVVDLGAFAWFALKVAMTLLAFRWSFQLCEEQGIAFPPWAQSLTVLLSLRPIVGDLQHGNVNLLILFLVIATLHAFHQRRDFAAGLLLALAITCKVTPALFVLYFLWKRAWHVLAGTAVGLVLFFAIVPGSILGYQHTFRITQSWLDKMILPYTVRGEVTTEHHNQSLPGLIYRLLTKNPSFLDEDEKPVEFHNVASLHPDTARLLVKACGVAFLAGLALVCRARTEPRTQTRLAAEYALVVVGMLLFSERTWKHHCVTLVLPWAVICYHLATAALPLWQRNAYLAAAGTATLVMATTSTSLWEAFVDYKMGAKLAQTYGAFVWAYFLILGTLLAVIWQRRKQETKEMQTPLPSVDGW